MWSDTFGGSAWVMLAVLAFLIAITIVLIQLCRERPQFRTDAQDATEVTQGRAARLGRS
jgi:hypothetical protein